MHLRHYQLGLSIGLLATVGLFTVGCEGLFHRKHDTRVVDVQPPPEVLVPTDDAEPVELPNFPDMVEDMMVTRQALIDQLVAMESAYLKAGDSVRANWARHQRERTEGVELYPYLTAEPVEHRVDVSPEMQIPEADKIYDEGLALLNQVRGIPLAGALERNKEKMREALVCFKRVLSEYPTSDKVDDCAYFCGEIYKEYLREEDPDDELAIRYYKWAFALDPNTPHPARFQCAVVYEFRRHDRARALEMYTKVLETEEAGNMSNARFAADRVAALSDEDVESPFRPKLATTDTELSSPVAEPRESGVTARPRASELDTREPEVEP